MMGTESRGASNAKVKRELGWTRALPELARRVRRRLRVDGAEERARATGARRAGGIGGLIDPETPARPAAGSSARGRAGLRKSSARWASTLDAD
jgi:hypothetical protein